MELRHVEYVLAVIDHGSFTAGAVAVGVAQPSLSEGVRRLESELGVRLFDRIGRSVAITDAGRAFEGPARSMLRERAVALDAVGAVRALETGTLELVALPTLAVDPLAALVGRFRTLHPGVAVRVVEPDDADALAAQVADGHSEVGLAELPARRDDLVAIVLARQEIVAVCPPGTKLPAPGRLPVSALAGMPLVATPPGKSTRDLLDRALAAASVAPYIAVEISQREALAPLVLNGAGTSFLPRAMADSLGAQGAVVARLVPALTRTIGLVHRAHPLTPSARAFVELARAKKKR
ncbi:MAG TPA: LysR substrate-binding domain-containing protein [Acidimicrobiia bacterium]|jgi:DNA-binding transcriptional LysR family regulator|nr:LysR substrate-binding domain-containing protein [Acidimicrobiia bacterium]